MGNKFVHHARRAKTNYQTNDDRSLWDRFWRNAEGRIVIAQMPNFWLILWLILELISVLVASHHVEIITWWLASAALGVWSLLEIFRGENYFRRLLGLCVALLTVMTVFGVGL